MTEARAGLIVQWDDVFSWYMALSSMDFLKIDEGFVYVASYPEGLKNLSTCAFIPPELF